MKNDRLLPHIAIVGGGPAGLMAADVISAAGLHVDLYDAMPSVGRKFLLAGIGGLNLTHIEASELFVARYRANRDCIEPLLREFDANAARAWAHELGIETFVGSSGRVFPREMKAAPLLRSWLRRLRHRGVHFHVHHRWNGWRDNGALCFMTPQGEQIIEAQIVILALGGGSWSRLGSDGAWVPLLQQRGIAIAPLKAANCGFDVEWSLYFKHHFAGQPVKSIALRHGGRTQRGEFIATQHGIEGSAIYALAAELRDAIERDGYARMQIDLTPDRAHERLLQALSQPRGSRSLAKHLHQRAGIDGVKAGLIREVLSAAECNDNTLLATTIKALPLELRAPRPLDEAISSAGGVEFAMLDDNLMLRDLPGYFCAGEMLDWEAPTGGYLLTACLAMGKRAGQGALDWLRSR
jgi:hypothetical protein